MDELTKGLEADLPEQYADVDTYLVADQKLRVLVYLFRLPFDLPLNHRDSWSIALEGDLGDAWDVEYFAFATEEMKAVFPMPLNLRQPHASVMFWRPSRESGVPLIDMTAVDKVAAKVFGERGASDEPDASGTDLSDTVVEVVTQAARSDKDPDDWPLVAIGFARALRAVNELLAAIGSATGEPAYRPLAVEELDAVALVSSRPVGLMTLDPEAEVDLAQVAASLPPEETAYLDPIPYILNPNLGVHVPSEPLTDREREKVNNFISAGRRGHPFLTYHRLVSKARRARESGDYAVAAIMAAASGEVLLNLVLRGMLVEEGSPERIPEMFDDPRGGFTLRLRREYGARLGRNWDLDDPTNDVGNWVNGTHNLRHRVVHAGHEPTAEEASEAIHGAEVLEAFVIERLVEKRYTYPKTALSLVGEQGFARRNLINARLAKVIAEEIRALDEFWRSMNREAGVTPSAAPEPSSGEAAPSPASR
jgi:hypothetical protein